MLKKLKEYKLFETGAGAGKDKTQFKYPGIRDAVDGNTAVIHVEREASDAAGAYPITPSTQMGEYWAEASAAGHLNISDRPLIFIEPESEHAAAGVTAGMSMTGLRAVNFSSGQGVAFMHESLYAAVGKRLPYVLNMGCRAITKASLNVHAGHDDYHCIDDTGFIQVMAKDAQGAADLNLIARKAAELSLTPAIVGQDGFLTTHLIESVMLPERELVAEYLGKPDDLIDTPTPAQAMLYGPKRRRVPAIWDVDVPLLSGSVQNQDAYMQAVAGQRPYFFDHIGEITDRCMAEFAELTGRRYQRVATYRSEDADYLILGMGSMIVQAEAVADYLRETRKLKVGVVDLTLFRPFPGDLLGAILKGKKGVAVLERTDQPLAEDLPLMREVRATLTKCLENGAQHDPQERATKSAQGKLPYAGYAAYASAKDMPRLYSGCYGLGSRDLQPEALIGTIENMLPDAAQKKFFYLSVDFVRETPANPKDEIHNQDILEAYPRIRELALRGSENPNLLPKDSITVRMHSVGGWGAITTGKNLAMTLYELLGWDIKANPKYGSEKKGQPTTYYLSAAPEPIRVNCEYVYVDVVLSPDPNVHEHSNPVAGLKKGGVFIVQSNRSEEDLWASFPLWMQKQIVDNDIRVFYLDAFQIAREEAGSADLQLRMQGIAFQGAFFAASPVMKNAGLTEEKLFKAVEDQLQAKFGGKGKRVVDDNLRVVRRGFTELKEITQKSVGATRRNLREKSAGLPVMLKQMPEGDGKVADIHRFWEQTGSFYASGKGSDNLVDPFIGASLVPAATGVFRDMTQIRFEYPEWIAENCTACGNCYTECPDSAIPGLVSSVADIFNTVVNRIETRGTPTRFLRRGVRTVEKRLRTMIEGDGAPVRELIAQAIAATVADAPPSATNGEEFVVQRPGRLPVCHHQAVLDPEGKEGQGQRRLFSITNPIPAACVICVTVCEDDVLRWCPDRRIAGRCAGLEFLARPAVDAEGVQPHRQPRREDRRAGDAAARQAQLRLDALRRRRLPRLRREDRHPPVHRHGDGADAAARGEARRATGRADRAPGEAHPHEADRVGGSLRHRRRAAGGERGEGRGSDTGQSGGEDHGEQAVASARPGLGEVGDAVDREAEGPEVALRRGTDEARSRRDGHRQLHRLHLGVGLDLSLPPVSLPLDQPPVPGLALGGDGHLRRPHGEDGGGLQGSAHGRAGTGRRVPRREARGFLPPLHLAAILRGGMAALPAGGLARRRRRDVRHRLPEPVAGADVRHADQGAGGRYAGVFEHRRPGLHLGLHRPDLRHGAVRRRPARQAGDAQGDQPDRHGASHVLRDVRHHRPHQSPDRELHRRPQLAPPGAVQYLRGVPARARHWRRQERGPEQAGGGRARLPAVPLRPGRRHDLLGMRQPGGQPGWMPTAGYSSAQGTTGR
jgi:pyruvate/2-oxoacid:ferredoxin oxidoreductase alpha subunit/Pyruvate/2-oxoacid:ferredoxin oxidoreductase gamma subunit/ferredoxin